LFFLSIILSCVLDRRGLWLICVCVSERVSARALGHNAAARNVYGYVCVCIYFSVKVEKYYGTAKLSGE